MQPMRRGIAIFLFCMLFLGQIPSIAYAGSVQGYLTTDEFVSIYNRYADILSEAQERSREYNFDIDGVKIYSMQKTSLEHVSYGPLSHGIVMYIGEYKTGDVAGINLAYGVADVKDKDFARKKGEALGLAMSLACIALGAPADKLDLFARQLGDIMQKSYNDLSRPYQMKVYNPTIRRNMVITHEFDKEEKCFELSLLYE